MKIRSAVSGQAVWLLTVGLAVLGASGCGSSGRSDPPAQPSPPPPPPPVSFTVELSGAQEVPPVETAASGSAELEIDLASGAVSGTLQVTGMEPTAAHIHDGHAGSNGPVIVPLAQDPADATRFDLPMNAALSAAQVDRLQAGGLYLNVHSAAYPGGEVRGQILPEDFSLVFASLSGRQQVPPQDTQVQGRAAVTLDESASATAIVHLTLFGLGNATGVGLHDGFAGTSGPALAQLNQSTTDPNHWFHDGLDLDADALAALLAGRFYLEASSAAFPDGLVRGQFVPDGIVLVLDTLSGDQEVPPVITDAAGVSALTLDPDSLEFHYHANTTDFDDANAAHIHDGFAGTNGPVVIPLEQDPMDPAHWSASGSLDEELLEKLLAGALYVNVHSPAYPGGEIRAQLEPENIEVIFADMDGDQMVPPVATAASGLAAVTVDKELGHLVAHVRLTELLMSTSGGIHRAPAGENGPERIALEQDSTDVDHWFALDAVLDEEDLTAFLQDGLYVLIGSQVNPDGEIRGQLVRAVAPEIPEAPSVTITLPEDGSEVSDTIMVGAEVEASLDIVEVRFLAGGELIGSDTTAPYAVEWDTTAVSDGVVTLTAQAEDTLGNVGVSAPISVTVANDEDTTSMTLAEIQSQVFGPICSVCHTGTTNELPFSMNLTSAQASFDHLVNVNSEQVPALLRVHPGNPDDSYLIHKLEGTQAVGDRMPQGGPFLDDDTIQGIRGWIADGAPAEEGDPPVNPPPGY
jgi:hypothetical protein